MSQGNHDKLNEVFKALNALSGSNILSSKVRRTELCRQALEMLSKDEQPALWARLQNDLATSLVQSPIGNYAKNIEQAINHYHMALEVLTQNSDAKLWAMTEFNLAGAYYKRIYGQREENLEQAISHGKETLRVFTREDFPHEWAQVENTLGEAYRVRIHGQRAENLETALRHFEQALIVHSREAFPEDWAMLQNNMAAAYADRLLGERIDNLENAIKHAEQALKIRTRQTDPEAWAMTQHNLGHAYRYRIRGDPAENIEEAIHCFQLALEVRSREALPKDWAESQNNLGDTYLARVNGEPDKNIREAIVHFQQALEVYTYSMFPEYWAQVQSNLGNGYLAFIENRAENIEKAIGHYEQALKVRTRKTFPEDWAQTLNNLAGAYTQRVNGEREYNIEQAIKHLQMALLEYTRRLSPQEWAGAQNNLAIAYTDRILGDKNDNIEMAISCYLHALEVYTPQTFPDLCLKASRSLGNLAFEERCWDLAIDSYHRTFEALALLMQASFSRTGKQVELSGIQNIPARAAYAYVQRSKDRQSEDKQADLKSAVEVVEQGRAQLLRESLELRRRDIEQLPALGFGNLHIDYLQAIKKLDELQKSAEISKGTRSEGWATQMEHALEKVREATVAIREKAGQRHPQYRYFLQALPFDEIQKQSKNNPLIYLSATPIGGLALIVTDQSIDSIELPELTQESLLKHIWSPSDVEVDRINANLHKGEISEEDIQAVSSGYFSMYAFWSLTGASKRQNQAWQETLDNITQWLWDVALGMVVSVLKASNHESAILIPAGYLALLPLHSAWVKDPTRHGRKRFALDELNITYVPSTHALWQVSMVVDRPTEHLMAVNNPDGSLAHLEFGVQAIVDMFVQSTHMRGKDATIEAVKEEMQKADVLHFFTHGSAGWQAEEQARLVLADGYLTLPEIFQLRLNKTRLAVLSACETGVPGLKLMDEMIGLPAGLMQAGVPGIVGSLWSVSAISTVLLMIFFYKTWRQDGLNPQDALRQAQFWLRDSTREQKKRLFKTFILKNTSTINMDTAISMYKYLSFAEPNEIDFSSPYFWGAFSYTGV